MIVDLSTVDEPVADVFKRLNVHIDDLMYSHEDFGNYQVVSHRDELIFRLTRDRSEYFLDWRPTATSTWSKSSTIKSSQALVQLIEQIVNSPANYSAM